MAAHGGTWSDYVDTPESVIEGFARFDAVEARVRAPRRPHHPEGPVVS